MVKSGYERSEKFSAKYDPKVIMFRGKALRLLSIENFKNISYFLYNLDIIINEVVTDFGLGWAVKGAVQKILYELTAKMPTLTALELENFILRLKQIGLTDEQIAAILESYGLKYNAIKDVFYKSTPLKGSLKIELSADLPLNYEQNPDFINDFVYNYDNNKYTGVADSQVSAFNRPVNWLRPLFNINLVQEIAPLIILSLDTEVSIQENPTIFLELLTEVLEGLAANNSEASIENSLAVQGILEIYNRLANSLFYHVDADYEFLNEISISAQQPTVTDFSPVISILAQQPIFKLPFMVIYQWKY